MKSLIYYSFIILMISSCKNETQDMSKALDKLDKDDFIENVNKAKSAINSNNFNTARIYISEANQNVTDEQDEIKVNEIKSLLNNKESEQRRREEQKRRREEQRRIAERNRQIYQNNDYSSSNASYYGNDIPCFKIISKTTRMFSDVTTYQIKCKSGDTKSIFYNKKYGKFDNGNFPTVYNLNSLEEAAKSACNCY